MLKAVCWPLALLSLSVRGILGLCPGWQSQWPRHQPIVGPYLTWLEKLWRYTSTSCHKELLSELTILWYVISQFEKDINQYKTLNHWTIKPTLRYNISLLGASRKLECHAGCFCSCFWREWPLAAVLLAFFLSQTWIFSGINHFKSCCCKRPF